MPRPGVAHGTAGKKHEKTRMISFKALIENTAFQPDVRSEHGFSLLINTGPEKIVFDTGQSDGFIHNADIFESGLQDVHDVVISHGHYDHSGGLVPLLKRYPHIRVHVKKEALVPKYSDAYKSLRQVNKPLVEAYSLFPANFHFAEKNFMLKENVMIVTETGVFNKYENDDLHLTWKPADKNIKDTFEDELFIILLEEEKMHIVTGCAHRGIINTIHTAMNLFPEKKIGSVIGGFHLKNKPAERIGLVSRDLNQLDISSLFICHCTGIDEYAILKSTFNGTSQYLSTGILHKLK